MRMKEESEKAGLKLNIQKTKITVSGSITSWQNRKGKIEAVTCFLSWTPKSLWMMTATMKLKDACSLEEKQQQTYLYSNEVTSLFQCIVQAMFFPESCTDVRVGT